MKDVEITVQVFNTFDEIDKILQQQGFKMIENYQLNDWYFSKLGNLQNIEYSELINNSFLVRQVLDSRETSYLCYKKKEFDKFGNVISEEKTKTKIDSLQNAIMIFKSSGLNNYAAVKNNSYVYKKDEIIFVVQVIEKLGIFIEYEEDDSMTNMKQQEKIDYMCNVVNSLNLKLGNDYFCKKVFMLLNKNANVE